MKTFRKWQYEVIGGYDEKYWLTVDVSNFGQVSAKRYVNSRCVVRVINEQGKAIGILHQTIHDVTKHINIMSTKMGGMRQELYNMGK